MAKDDKADGKIKAIEKIDSVLGLNLLKRDKVDIPSSVQSLIDEREVARKLKDWNKSDEIRTKIKKLGFIVLDGKDGPIIEKVGKNI
jgi:cysteinyl-tRNA synthetase